MDSLKPLPRWRDASLDSVTVFEGERINIRSDSKGLRRRERLLGTMVGNRLAFATRKGAVYATDFVGAVDVGGFRVEVLPKPYGIDDAEKARQLMFDLLRWAGVNINPAWQGGGSSKRQADLLELVERRAAQELLQRLGVGAPRRYQEVEEASSVLRGRILFSRYVRQSPSTAHILPIRYSPLVIDNDLGRLMKGLARTLRNRARSHESRRNLDRCLDLLYSVKDLPLTASLVAQVRLGRMEMDWAGLVDLAGLVAVGQTPAPASLGETAQATMLFPMNRLFELAVRRVLSASMSKPYECLRSPGQHRLLSMLQSDGSVCEALSIRPDFLFRKDGAIIAAGDAKWKRLSDSPPRFSIQPADLYQLLAYMRQFETKSGVLFFPRTSWMPKDWSAAFMLDAYSETRIHVIAVDLATLVGRVDPVCQEASRSLASRVEAAINGK